MAKLQDKLMNRVIEGELALDSAEQEGIVNSTNVKKAINGQDINVNGITSKGIANTGNIGNIGDIATTGKITGGEIIENMSGYSFATYEKPTYSYAGVVKNGNKITFAIAGTITRVSGEGSNYVIGKFTVPSDIASKLYPNTLGALTNINISMFNGTTSNVVLPARMAKSDNELFVTIYNGYTLTDGTTYEFRFEATFLLSENLIGE